MMMFVGIGNLVQVENPLQGRRSKALTLLRLRYSHAAKRRLFIVGQQTAEVNVLG
jgi:hypothetical protein